MRSRNAPIVITGGSGFIGSNLADSLLGDGEDVVILDNLSRPGVRENLAWLRERHRDRVHPALLDVRDLKAIEPIIAEAKAVFHLAAQTAVTTSLDDPIADFEANARGTLNVLEAARRTGRRIPVVFSSTNKVYGSLDDIAMLSLDDRYVPANEATKLHGVGEMRRLDFCTPYGCSKGVADQYVLDYAKTYGIPAAVLRMSCIYGPHQFGTEDQGWVAHFLLRALAGKPIVVFGDGRQVRDVLHVHDAVRAYRGLLAAIDTLSGKPFNLGGGPANAVSVRMVLQEIERIVGRRLDLCFEDVRPGDQRYFVADTRRLQSAIDWRAQVNWRQGVPDLADWLLRNRSTPTFEKRKASA